MSRQKHLVAARSAMIVTTAIAIERLTDQASTNCEPAWESYASLTIAIWALLSDSLFRL